MSSNVKSSIVEERILRFVFIPLIVEEQILWFGFFSLDSLGTNKFVILHPFDSWETNMFVLIQKKRLRVHSSCYGAEESIPMNQFR